MNIQATALILATILGAYPNASAERSLDGQSAVLPRWSTLLVSANPKLRHHPPAASGTEQALGEVTDRGACSDQEFSWTFTSSEAMPPDFEPGEGEVDRRDASVRM